MSEGMKHGWGAEGSAAHLRGVTKANVHHQPIFFLPGNPIKEAVLALSSG